MLRCTGCRMAPAAKRLREEMRNASDLFLSIHLGPCGGLSLAPSLCEAAPHMNIVNGSGEVSTTIDSLLVSQVPGTDLSRTCVGQTKSSRDLGGTR